MQYKYEMSFLVKDNLKNYPMNSNRVYLNL